MFVPQAKVDRLMRVLLAPDKFKGSLSALQVCEALEVGLLRVRPDLDIVLAPVADGGDGSLEAALRAGFELVPVEAVGATGDPRHTGYARKETVALVELADICGLALLGAHLDPLRASSYGLGMVMRAALDAGVASMWLAIGGSASTDGGSGMLAALGARFLDRDGKTVALGGGGLAGLSRVDLDGLHPRLAEVHIAVACDVVNPLCGPAGAASVYGAQKGASPDQIATLDAGLARLARLLAANGQEDLAEQPGAGAAGGVGFGALVLGARLKSGIASMLELTGFARALEGVDVVITGEGALDEQTLAGKAPAGVAAAAAVRGIPVLAVAGSIGLGEQTLVEAGFARAYAISDLEPDLKRSMAFAPMLLRHLGANIAMELDLVARSHTV